MVMVRTKVIRTKPNNSHNNTNLIIHNGSNMKISNNKNDSYGGSKYWGPDMSN